MGTPKNSTALSTKLNNLASGKIGSPCRIGEIHRQLDADTGQALLRALQSEATTRSIHLALKEEGFAVSRETVMARRKCFKNPTDAQCECFPNNTETK